MKDLNFRGSAGSEKRSLRVFELFEDGSESVRPSGGFRLPSLSREGVLTASGMAALFPLVTSAPKPGAIFLVIDRGSTTL